MEEYALDFNTLAEGLRAIDFDRKSFESLAFMMLPVLLYVTFVIKTFKSSSSSVVNSENSYWVYKKGNANPYHNLITRGQGNGTFGYSGNGAYPNQQRIEMLSNGMMILRKPNAQGTDDEETPIQEYSRDSQQIITETSRISQ
ncbi:MAG: hypothetical protein IEMM0002_1140 [bacterium]|nr:MAG: hypothetical protein IEMM0002_1140 [bacterium]